MTLVDLFKWLGENPAELPNFEEDIEAYLRNKDVQLTENEKKILNALKTEPDPDLAINVMVFQIKDQPDRIDPVGNSEVKIKQGTEANLEFQLKENGETYCATVVIKDGTINYDTDEVKITSLSSKVVPCTKSE